MNQKYARYNVESRMWEYGHWSGSVFVILAKYPAANTEYARAA